MTDTPPSSKQTSGIDTSVPHSARIWNYWLGGKDNYPVDRAAGDEYREIFPGIVDIARAFRYFLTRSVRFLAQDAGIRQFLDVGTGLPTVDNTHEVAQRVAPESRVVYVDNDPLVLAHAHALLVSSPQGTTHYIDANLHQPEAILREAARTLDFSQPIALTLMGVLGHVDDTDEAHSIAWRLMDGLPTGSYLALADSCDTDATFVEAQRRYNEGGSVPYNLRKPEEIVHFFDGLELVEPGVVTLPEWRPELTPFDSSAGSEALGGVGRKR